MKKIKKQKSKFKDIFRWTGAIFLFILISALFTFPARAGTAGLYLTPASGSYILGQGFSVKIVVVTGGEYINAVSTNLSYPTDLLEVRGVSTNGSFITIWAENNVGDGNIRVSGGLPTPGFNGEGLIATVNFKVLKPGQASIRFDEGTLVLRDSDNENILSSKFGATFSLKEPVPTPTPQQNPTPTELPSPTLVPTDSLPSPTLQFATPTLLVKREPSLIKENLPYQDQELERVVSPASFWVGFAFASFFWATALFLIYRLKRGGDSKWSLK